MKIKKAYLIDERSITRQPQLEGKELDLEVLYPLVECHIIEHVGLKKGVDLWVDEEGLLKPNFINRIASKMYQGAYPHVKEELGIAGRAILTDNTKKGDYIENCYK